MVLVRYFAAAAAAAGTASETLDAATLGDLLDALAAHGEEFVRVLGRCTVLVDGRAATASETALTPGSTVDVLPPFAGG